MARFAVLATLAVAVATVAGDSSFDYGLEMAQKAAQGACWYEYLEIMPDASEQRGHNFGNCNKNMNLKNIQAKFDEKAKHKKHLDVKKSLKNQLRKNTKKHLPEEYHSCGGYADDADKTFENDKFSSILKDKDDAYPFKGYAHCIIAKLGEAHGKSAVDNLSDHWYKDTPWIKVINDRENANRAKSGVGPLTVDPVLTERAQKWADMLAKKCHPLELSDHIKDSNPDYNYKDQPTGENLMQGMASADNKDNALLTANSWYEEIASYPWPSYDGDNADDTFYQIGHFTQQVWKGSNLAGYGLARRDGCKNVYVVGRYWPAGNYEGQYASNVLPPQ